jgi:hypothetical protein
LSNKKIFNIYENLPEFLEWMLEGEVLSTSDDGLTMGPLTEEQTPQLTLNKVEQVDEFLSNGGECILNPGLKLNGKFLSHALKRYLGLEKNSLNLDELSNGELQQQYSLKLCDHLTLGEYSDVISTDAYLQQHNFVNIRNYILKCMSYFSYLNKGDISFIPIDIEYGFSKDKFFIQVHANIQNFVKEYLISAFKESDREHPYQSLLKDAYGETDFMEIVYLESAEKIIISSVWFKDIGYEDFFPSLIINNIKSFEEKKSELDKRHRIKVVKTVINISSTELPGRSVDLIGGISENKKNLGNIKHIIEVIQRFRAEQGEDNRVLLTEMSASDIDSYDKLFEGENLTELSSSQKEYVIECLRNPSELKNLEKGIDQILSPFDGEAYAGSFSENLEELSAEEVNRYVEEAVREEQEEYVEKLTNDSWDEKKKNISEKIKKQVKETFKVNGRVEMNSSFMNIIASGLNTSKEVVKTMINDLGNKSVDELVKNKIDQGEMSIEGLQNELKRQAQGYENQLIESKDKNTKSKKIIDMMKGQIASMADVEKKINTAKEQASFRGEELSEKLQMDFLKLELKNALTDVKNRETTIDKIRQSTDQIIKIKDKEITKLNRKEIPSSKGENMLFKKTQIAAEEIFGDDNPVEVILKLTEDNKSLNNQIDVLQKRYSNLNENMEKKSNEKQDRSESQISKLRVTTSEQAKALMDVREEKEKYLRMCKVKEQDYIRKQEEVRLLKIKITEHSLVPKQITKKLADKVDQSAIVERAFAEEMKSNKTKMKAYEQKIKFLNAQLDAANKKANLSGNTKQNSKLDGASNLKLKQLETLKLKAEDDLAKSLKSVSSAKKEAHGLKQQLITAQNKISELERKTGKKAA